MESREREPGVSASSAQWIGLSIGTRRQGSVQGCLKSVKIASEIPAVPKVFLFSQLQCIVSYLGVRGRREQLKNLSDKALQYKHIHPQAQKEPALNATLESITRAGNDIPVSLHATASRLWLRGGET
jgi:hypothetical protein